MARCRRLGPTERRRTLEGLTQHCMRGRSGAVTVLNRLHIMRAHPAGHGEMDASSDSMGVSASLATVRSTY
jgi:hypothetical protein